MRISCRYIVEERHAAALGCLQTPWPARFKTGLVLVTINANATTSWPTCGAICHALTGEAQPSRILGLFASEMLTQCKNPIFRVALHRIHLHTPSDTRTVANDGNRGGAPRDSGSFYLPSSFPRQRRGGPARRSR